MDGMSFAPMLLKTGDRPWKGAALIEYLSVSKVDHGGGPLPKGSVCKTPFSVEETREYVSAFGYHADTQLDKNGTPLLCHQVEGTSVNCKDTPRGQNCHFYDGPNNTFAALRIIDGEQDLLYAEFTNVNNPKAWDFAPDQMNFFEFYNVTKDYYMLTNIYAEMPNTLKEELHARLQSAVHCKGSKECNEALKLRSSSNTLVQYV